MNFSCNSCGKQFVTPDELVVGRGYQVICGCGNSILLRVDAAAATERAPSRPMDDPFAPRDPSEPVLASSREFTLIAGAATDTGGHGLAPRDPDASAEDADEGAGPCWVPLEWARRTFRVRGFVAGAATGAVVALLVSFGLDVAGTAVPSPPSGSEPAVAIVKPVSRRTVARSRRAPSSPTASGQTIVAEPAGLRPQSSGVVNAEPEASAMKAAERENDATPSKTVPAATSVDPPTVPTSADRVEPATKGAEALAAAGNGAPTSDDAVAQGAVAQAGDEPKREAAVPEADRDGLGAVERVVAQDRTDARAMLVGASTVSAKVPTGETPAGETIATANASP